MDSPSDRSNTPSAADPRFASQKETVEELLKSQTVGLVRLDDFRKRRAEALELQDRDTGSGRSTPAIGDRTSSPQPVKKKKKKTAAKGKLSFGLDDEEGDESPATTTPTITPRSATPLDASDDNGQPVSRRGPNAAVAFAPKIMTKAAMAKEAETRERLRKEFLSMQALVKATEFVLPFVFYDGTNIPGGTCRMKKGDPVWLFLDKSRKLGAESGAGTDRSRREWARVGIDDLMLVRNEIIIPHHYEFYHFIANKTKGFQGLLFNYSTQPTQHSPTAAQLDPASQPEYDPLSRPGKAQEKLKIADDVLEGFNDDPTVTKVVDRRWYDKNKHIFPASIWEDFDPTKDYTTAIRKDAQGNAFFLPR